MTIDNHRWKPWELMKIIDIRHLMKILVTKPLRTFFAFRMPVGSFTIFEKGAMQM